MKKFIPDIDKGITKSYTFGMKTKTAISIPAEMLKNVEEFAQKHNCSKSKVFVIAMEEYLERVKSKNLLDTINEAYSEGDSPAETKLIRKAKEHFIKSVLKDKY